MSTERAGVHVVHVINEHTIKGGAQKQLAELVSRSALDHEVVEVGEPSLSTLRRLRSDLASADPELVVAWLERAQLALACVASPRWRIAASVRNLPDTEGLRSRWQLRLALSRYRHLITNSASSSRAIRKFIRPLRPPPATAIPNGVERPSGVERDSAPLSRDSLRIAFVGRASPRKGLDLLLEALSMRDLPPLEATMVGAGVPEAVAAAPASPRGVRALPQADDPWSVVGDCDVLVVPSRLEGSPNVVIEAFIRGIPVIATAVGGSPELLADDRGLLVAPQDPHAIARALREVAENREQARARAAIALAYAETAHEWASVIGVWDALLRRLGRSPKNLSR